jgi:hypothetical protein
MNVKGTLQMPMTRQELASLTSELPHNPETAGSKPAATVAAHYPTLTTIKANKVRAGCKYSPHPARQVQRRRGR